MPTEGWMKYEDLGSFSPETEVRGQNECLLYQVDCSGGSQQLEIALLPLHTEYRVGQQFALDGAAVAKQVLRRQGRARDIILQQWNLDDDRCPSIQLCVLLVFITAESLRNTNSSQTPSSLLLLCTLQVCSQRQGCRKKSNPALELRTRSSLRLVTSWVCTTTGDTLLRVPEGGGTSSHGAAVCCHRPEMARRVKNKGQRVFLAWYLMLLVF